MNTIFNRHRHSIIGFSLLCCLSFFFIMSQESNVTFADSDLEENTESLLVGIPRGITAVEAKTILQDANLGDLTIEKIWPEFGIALIKIPERSSSPIMAASTDAMQRLETYRQALEQIPAVNYVGYNSAISIPTMTNYDLDEHLSAINQSSIQVSSNVTNNQEVIVALIDSGFGRDESDINQSSSQAYSNATVFSITDSIPSTEEIDPSAYPLWENQAEFNGIGGVDDDENGFIDDFHGWDWVDNDNVMDDKSGHGTQVGKTIVDLVEQAQVDRNSVKLMPLRILREDGKGEISDLIDALSYAMRTGAQIANLNLVSYYDNPFLKEATKIANEGGLLIVAPSVFQCRSRGFWPASYHEVLGVTYFIDVEVSGFLCPARYEADLVVNIRLDDMDHTNLSLRSLPVPYTTGLAALVLLDNPDFSNIDIKTEILNMADYSGVGFLSGIPILDIQKEIQERIVPTALSETAEPKEHDLYLPFITK